MNKIAQLIPVAAGATACLLSIAVRAQHYPIGAEGLMAATLPPPGVYLRDYNAFYFADRLNDAGGHDVNAGLDLFAYAQVPRLMWITPVKILGAYYGMDALVPFVYTDFKATGYRASKFGLGDVMAEPVTLSWHWQQFDAAVAYGLWIPTGTWEPYAPENPGKGYYGHMFTLGGTWYPDLEKTWSFSALGRYEVNSGRDALGILHGDTLSIEGGVGKSLSKTLQLGVVGYLQQQVTDDRGAGATGDLSQVWGLGPEVSAVFPKCGVMASLRYVRELGAESRPEGNTVMLTLTKRF